MVRQCIDALAQFHNSSLLDMQEDREQVLGKRKLQLLYFLFGPLHYGGIYSRFMAP